MHTDIVCLMKEKWLLFFLTFQKVNRTKRENKE